MPYPDVWNAVAKALRDLTLTHKHPDAYQQIADVIALVPTYLSSVCLQCRTGMPVLMIKHASAAIALLVTPVAALGGCANQASNNPSPSTTSPTSGSASSAQTISAQMSAPDGTKVADASVDFANGYATVTVQTVGTGILSPGFHGLHIHAVGRCAANSVAPSGGQSADFASAGDRFQAPGHTAQPASGDLPPLLVRSDGSGKLVATSDGFTLDQLKGPEGSSIVLDQGTDLVAPATGSDKRIACGVLSPASVTSTSTSISTSVSTSVVTTTAVSVAPPTTFSATPTSTPPTTTVTGSTSTSTSTVTVIQPTLPPITVPGPPGPNGG